MKIGFHASHEQFAPSLLLALAAEAQDAGFEAIKSSDHFHPWSDEHAQAGFAWSWLGAAMAHAPAVRHHYRSRLPVSPGYRGSGHSDAGRNVS